MARQKYGAVGVKIGAGRPNNRPLEIELAGNLLIRKRSMQALRSAAKLLSLSREALGVVAPLGNGDGKAIHKSGLADRGMCRNQRGIDTQPQQLPQETE
jgi:hypothetical protein